MKAKRHAKILELISRQSIETQEELLAQLNLSGFGTTQATVSRDIRELRLVKTQTENGYRYIAGGRENADIAFKFSAVFSESVTAIDFAGNIVVIKCYSGMAGAACAAIDSLRWAGVVGTIAGDDTIFCVTRSSQDAAALAGQLGRQLSQKG